MDKIILQKIKQICESNDIIIAAYLFGSFAKASEKPNSDVDLAILLDQPESDEFPLLSFITNIEKAIERQTDVVVLNRAGEVIKYEVRRTGRLIFERDVVKRRRFEVIGRKLYEDFLYLHRRYTKCVLYGESIG